jgi:hypothetical protein
VDPVPDPLLFFSGSAENLTRASGSVAKNSNHAKLAQNSVTSTDKSREDNLLVFLTS